jgi:hypothetical protein
LEVGGQWAQWKARGLGAGSVKVPRNGLPFSCLCCPSTPQEGCKPYQHDQAGQQNTAPTHARTAHNLLSAQGKGGQRVSRPLTIWPERMNLPNLHDVLTDALSRPSPAAIRRWDSLLLPDGESRNPRLDPDFPRRIRCYDHWTNNGGKACEYTWTALRGMTQLGMLSKAPRDDSLSKALL